MVRFCDKDIVSVNYGSIHRQELLICILRAKSGTDPRQRRGSSL